VDENDVNEDGCEQKLGWGEAWSGLSVVDK